MEEFDWDFRVDEDKNSSIEDIPPVEVLSIKLDQFLEMNNQTQTCDTPRNPAMEEFSKLHRKEILNRLLNLFKEESSMNENRIREFNHFNQINPDERQQFYRFYCYLLVHSTVGIRLHN